MNRMTILAVLCVGLAQPLLLPAGAQIPAVQRPIRSTLHGRLAGAGLHKRLHAIPWSQTLGAPKLEAGKQVGYFIWHDAKGVYLATTNEVDKGQVFRGAVRVRPGSIANVAGVKLEKQDRFKQTKPNVVQFRFVTHEGVDGITFQVSDMSRFIAFRLNLASHVTAKVFLGAKMTEAQNSGRPGVYLFNLAK
ncbi:MAG: hypothetical protein KGJ62_07590 [Armatimonadetes bacterium]|nr:hypothetical protein [Armatimonadota bacterium]MDE2207219.1 hypothetical protein [Armatimonadota bacterium]